VHALWGVNTIQQTFSKLPANVFKIHVNCWTFAGSCKHTIRLDVPLPIIAMTGRSTCTLDVWTIYTKRHEHSACLTQRQ